MTILVTSNYKKIKNSQVVDGDRGDFAEFTNCNYLTILVTSNYKNSQVVNGDCGDLAEFRKKTPHRS